MDVKYESIRSLIIEEDWGNSKVKLKFKTNNQNRRCELVDLIFIRIMKVINTEFQSTITALLHRYSNSLYAIIINS